MLQLKVRCNCLSFVAFSLLFGLLFWYYQHEYLQMHKQPIWLPVSRSSVNYTVERNLSQYRNEYLNQVIKLYMQLTTDNPIAINDTHQTTLEIMDANNLNDTILLNCLENISSLFNIDIIAILTKIKIFQIGFNHIGTTNLYNFQTK